MKFGLSKWMESKPSLAWKFSRNGLVWTMRRKSQAGCSPQVHRGLADISRSHTMGSSHILNLAHPGLLVVLLSSLSGVTTLCDTFSELPLFHYKLSILMPLVLRGVSQVPAHQSVLGSDKVTLCVFIFNVCSSISPIWYTIHRGQVMPSLLAIIYIPVWNKQTFNKRLPEIRSFQVVPSRIDLSNSSQKLTWTSDSVTQGLCGSIGLELKRKAYIEWSKFWFWRTDSGQFLLAG